MDKFARLHKFRIGNSVDKFLYTHDYDTPRNLPIQIINNTLFYDPKYADVEEIKIAITLPVFKVEVDANSFIDQMESEESLLEIEVSNEIKNKFRMIVQGKKGPILSVIPNSQEFYTTVPNSMWAHTTETVSWAKKIAKHYLTVLSPANITAVSDRVNETASISDLVSNVSTTGTVNLDDVVLYLRLRHDYFASEVCKALGFEIADTDKRFMDAEGLITTKLTFEESMMAPDVIIPTTEGFMVLEFYVTDSMIPSMIHRVKENKYKGIIAKLSLAQSMTFMVIGWSTQKKKLLMEDQTVMTTIDDNEGFKFAMNEMKHFHSEFTKIHNYEEIRKHHDMFADTKFQDLAQVNIANKAMNEALAERLVPHRTFGLANSMDKDLIVNPTVKNMGYNTDADKKFLQDKGSVAADSVFLELMKESRTTHGPEVLSMFYRAEAINKELHDLDGKRMAERSMYLEHSSLPRLFKIPLLNKAVKGAPYRNYYPSWRHVHSAADGTVLFRMKRDNFNHKDFWGPIGTDPDDISLVTDSMKVVSDSNYDSQRFHETLALVEEMAREIMLLDLRRYMVDNIRGVAAFKKYDNFSVVIAPSGQGKSDSQLVIKILVKAEQGEISSFGRSFTSVKKDVYATDWFTLQMTDLEHYSKIHSVFNIAADDILMKMREAREDNELTIGSETMWNILTPLVVVLLEHKRNTSTMIQSTRYVMHAITSALADRVGVISDFAKVPVRSVIQSYLYQKVMSWVSEFNEREPVDMKNTGSMRSMYSDEMVPFEITMSEIYYSNLFNVNAGMQAHREKEILDKMIKVEKEYITRVREDEVLMSFEHLYRSPQKNCQLNAEMIKSAFQFFMNKPGSAESIQKASRKALTLTVDKVLKMTRTVTAIPEPFGNFIKRADKLEKKTVFEGVWEMLEKFGTNDLIEIMSGMDMFVAIFSTFAKPQVGAGREILIQTIMTRFYTAVFNSFFEVLCEDHPKEMVTKEHMKSEIQSRTAMEMRNDEGMFQSRANIAFSINSDASKWAPNQVMVWYGFAIEVMRKSEYFPDKLADMFIDVLASYATKLVFIPTTMKEKLSKWTSRMIRADEIVSRAKDFTNRKGRMTIRSGMGQGNFQHPSSFMHCVIDDYLDHLMLEALKSSNMGARMVTLISSDDSTKMVLVSVENPTKDRLTSVIPWVMDMFISGRKAAGIMINAKKTAAHRMITEFNSNFTKAKKVFVAAIKHIYNCVNIVDMTSMSGAVEEALANTRRVLESGCFVSTVKVALEENRKRLIKFFCLAGQIERLKKLLDVDEADLPSELGFVPTKYPVETLLFGSKIHITSDKGNLKRFYKRYYSSSSMSTSEELSDDYTSSVEIVMPQRMDKSLEALRDNTVRKTNKYSDVKAYSVSIVAKTGIYKMYMLYLSKYVNSIKSSFAFSSSMKRHSMIRALQASSSVTTRAMIKTKAEPIKIVSMVNKILRLDNYQSFLGFYSYYDEIVEEARRTESAINQPGVDMACIPRNPKNREIMAFRHIEFEGMSAEKFIRTIMSDSANVQFKTVNMEERVYMMAALNPMEMYDNPLATMNKSSLENQFQMLERSVRMYTKNFSYRKTAFVLDNPTTMNRESDIRNIYRSRTDAVNTLLVEADTDHMSLKIFMNALTFKREVDDSDYPTDTKISIGNSKELAAIKMVKETNIAEKISDSSLDYTLIQPAFSRRNVNGMLRFSWLQGQSLAILLDDGHNLSVRLYGKRTAGIMTFVSREIYKICTDRRSALITYQRTTFEDTTTNTVSARDFLDQKLIRDTMAMQMPKITATIQKGNADWRVIIKSEQTEMEYIRRKYGYYLGTPNPPDLMTRFTKIINTDTSIKDVSDFMNDLGMKANIEEKENVSEYYVPVGDTISAMVAHLADNETFDLGGLADSDADFHTSDIPSELANLISSAEFRTQVSESKVVDRLDYILEINLAITRSVRRELVLNSNLASKLGYDCSMSMLISTAWSVLGIDNLNSLAKVKIAITLLRSVISGSVIGSKYKVLPASKYAKMIPIVYLKAAVSAGADQIVNLMMEEGVIGAEMMG